MLLIFIYICYLFINRPYNGSFKLYAGQYTFHLYGGQGGRGYDGCRLMGYGGKGAYVRGTLKITGTGTTFYAFVAGMGSYDKCTGPNIGGFNGGGNSGIDTPFDNESDDASGAGGGATDIRLNYPYINNRIIVAAGGAGAACNCDGPPGGDLTGYYAYDNNLYAPSKLVNQTAGEESGVGQNGHDHIYTPGSGAGGGWRGGIAPTYLEWTGYYEKSWSAAAHSGSSYISGYPGCITTQNVVFTNGYMKIGVKEGNGSLEIVDDYICSTNCINCANASACIQCKSGYYMYFNRTCKSTCTNGYILWNALCYPCLADGCSVCSSPTIKTCKTCKSDYYMYQNYCYKKCSVLNGNKYFGNDVVNKVCKQCIDENCIKCDSNYNVCNKCASKYHMVAGRCVHDPTEKFTLSSVFTKSSTFSSSHPFTKSLTFSNSHTFTKSTTFSNSNVFTKSGIFNDSEYFSLSDYFTKSGGFSHSKVFSMSDIFSISVAFIKSQQFRGSNCFSHSSIFSKSNAFSNSEKFSYSNDFSKSKLFKNSLFFTNSDDFTHSVAFSNSKHFTKSELFSSSLSFLPSSNFTQSNIFMKSIEFSKSNIFTISRSFTFSIFFTHTDLFSLSNIFSMSHHISESQTFVSQIITNPKKKSAIIILGIPIMIAVLILSVFLVLFIIFMKKKKDEKSEDIDQQNSDTKLAKELNPTTSESELFKSNDSNDRDINFWL